MEELDTLIIGAGPAGLQLGAFLEEGGFEYKILERAASAASFFQNYPLSGKLISINKVHTGTTNKEFNLRHDWNSLLTDKMPPFTTRTEEYYPDRDELVKYLQEFAAVHALKIQYKSNVETIRKDEAEKGTYSVFYSDGGDEGLKKIVCRRLVVATGLSSPVRPTFLGEVARPIRHYADFEPDYFTSGKFKDEFRNKSVCIFGGGNSSYELANLLTPVASSIVVSGRNTKKFSAVSHYTGDIRAVYLPYFDTFFLKSMNVINGNVSGLTITQSTPTAPYRIEDRDGCTKEDCVHKGSFLSKLEFDEVIYCTGWRFNTNIFDFPVAMTPNQKYPALTPSFEMRGHSNLFCIGSIGHAADFKKSSGGFIHGFRYLIQELYTLMFLKKVNQTLFPAGDLEAITRQMITNANEGSALYQMHSQLADIVYWNPATKSIHYIPHTFPNYANAVIKNKYATTCFTFTLEYNKTQTKEFASLGVKESRVGTEARSVLLHPIIRVIRCNTDGDPILLDEMHLDEDAFMNFMFPTKYWQKLYRFLVGYATELGQVAS